MKTFKEYLEESNEPKKLHEIGLNKSQLSSLAKHPSYNTYIKSYDYPTVYAKMEDGNTPGETKNIILTNSGNRHKMHVALTNRGKVLSHSVHEKQKTDDGAVQWKHIKTIDGA